jgi:hypothetical protein
MHCDIDCKVLSKSLEAGQSQTPGTTGGGALMAEDLGTIVHANASTEAKKKKTEGGDVQVLVKALSDRGFSASFIDTFMSVLTNPKVILILKEEVRTNGR